MSCNTGTKPTDTTTDTETKSLNTEFVLTEAEISEGRLTPEIMWKFGRLGNVELSPDGKTFVFGVTKYNLKENKGGTFVYTMPVSDGNPVLITPDKGGYSNLRWHPVKGNLWYIADKDGTSQIWEMETDGSKQHCISDIKDGITGFEISPDGKYVMYLKRVKLENDIHDIYPDLPEANAMIISDLGYRHWDKWHDNSYSHIFIAQADGSSLKEGKDIMEGELWDAPLRPFYDQSDITWSPAGDFIAYVSRKLLPTEAMQSTNSDIYLYSLKEGTTTNLTEAMPGYDKYPVFSPDGKRIAFLSMETPGYESDKNRLFVLDLSDGSKHYLTKEFDQDVANMAWEPDGSGIVFLSGIHATEQIYTLDISSGKIRQITKGNHDYTSVFCSKDCLAGVKMSHTLAPELFLIDKNSGEETQRTFVNEDIYKHIKFGKEEGRWMPTVDGKQMLTWVIYPPDFDPSVKYPALLYCQGGPQSSVSQFWSYRWNFQLMAAQGYIVIAPNRRGLPSFGQEWNDQIAGDYGGLNMKDYLQAVDLMKKEPFIDNDRVGAVGASYGGFSVFWLAGNHKGRFKAFIAHCGMMNLESQYGITDEYWFVNHDLGGPYWEMPKPRSYNDFSPHKYISEWDTPILVIHGGKDFRIPYTEAMQAFNAARLKGIPSEFLFFPEEGHWILKPQNSILWNREFFGWLERWLK